MMPTIKAHAPSPTAPGYQPQPYRLQKNLNLALAEALSWPTSPERAGVIADLGELAEFIKAYGTPPQRQVRFYPVNHGFTLSIALTAAGMTGLRIYRSRAMELVTRDFAAKAPILLEAIQAHSLATRRMAVLLDRACRGLLPTPNAADMASDYFVHHTVRALYIAALVGGPQALLVAVIYYQAHSPTLSAIESQCSVATETTASSVQRSNSNEVADHANTAPGHASPLGELSYASNTSGSSTSIPRARDPRLTIKAHAPITARFEVSPSPVTTPSSSSTGMANVSRISAALDMAVAASTGPLGAEVWAPWANEVGSTAAVSRSASDASCSMSVDSPLSTPQPHVRAEQMSDLMLTPTTAPGRSMKRSAPPTRSPSPQAAQRLRLDATMPLAATAATTPPSASFDWVRNGRAIHSDVRLMTALTLGPDVGAAGTLYSARLGQLLIENAPLEIFAIATSVGREHALQSSLLTLPINGWTVTCTPAQSLMLLAEGASEASDGVQTLQLQGLAVESKASVLRALVRVPTGDNEPPFEGTINGRGLTCSLADLKMLIGPGAQADSHHPAWVTIEIGGNEVQAPAAALRGLIIMQAT